MRRHLPAAGTRSPVAPDAASLFQLHLPTRFLDGRVQFADFLGQVVDLGLEGRGVEHSYPANFLDPVAVGGLGTYVEDTLEDAVPQDQTVALGQGFGDGL